MITKELATTILGQMEKNEHLVCFCFFNSGFRDLWENKHRRLEIRKQCQKFIKDRNLFEWKSKESKRLLNKHTPLANISRKAEDGSPLTGLEQRRIFRINFLKWIIDGDN